MDDVAAVGASRVGAVARRLVAVDPARREGRETVPVSPATLPGDVAQVVVGEGDDLCDRMKPDEGRE